MSKAILTIGNKKYELTSEQVEAALERMEKPAEGQEFFYVSDEGMVNSGKYKEYDNFRWSREKLEFGNCFWIPKYKNPKEAAEMYKLRVESLKYLYIPIDGETVYIWSFKNEQSCEIRFIEEHSDWAMVKYFETEEACTEWGKKYNDAWKYPFKK